MRFNTIRLPAKLISNEDVYLHLTLVIFDWNWTEMENIWLVIGEVEQCLKMKLKDCDWGWHKSFSADHWFHWRLVVTCIP